MRFFEHSSLRWVGETQLNQRWNEIIVPAYREATNAFETDPQSVQLRNTIHEPSQILTREIDHALDQNLNEIAQLLNRYINCATIFLTNAFRHSRFYENSEDFIEYMRSSINEILLDIHNFLDTPRVNSLRRSYVGLDDLFKTSSKEISSLFSKLITCMKDDLERTEETFSIKATS